MSERQRLQILNRLSFNPQSLDDIRTGTGYRAPVADRHLRDLVLLGHAVYTEHEGQTGWVITDAGLHEAVRHANPFGERPYPV